MRLHPTVSSMTSWILVAALSLSPLMAQSSAPAGVKPVETDSEEPSSSVEPGVPSDSTTPVIPETAIPLAKPVHVALLGAIPEATFPTVAKRSTLPPAPSPAPSRAAADSPGESKWVILAALVATGAAVAAILLFRGFGGGKEPVGTVISAGSPSINAPNR